MPARPAPAGRAQKRARRQANPSPTPLTPSAAAARSGQRHERGRCPSPATPKASFRAGQRGGGAGGDMQKGAAKARNATKSARNRLPLTTNRRDFGKKEAERWELPSYIPPEGVHAHFDLSAPSFKSTLSSSGSKSGSSPSKEGVGESEVVSNDSAFSSLADYHHGGTTHSGGVGADEVVEVVTIEDDDDQVVEKKRNVPYNNTGVHRPAESCLTWHMAPPHLKGFASRYDLRRQQGTRKCMLPCCVGAPSPNRIAIHPSARKKKMRSRQLNVSHPVRKAPLECLQFDDLSAHDLKQSKGGRRKIASQKSRMHSVERSGSSLLAGSFSLEASPNSTCSPVAGCSSNDDRKVAKMSIRPKRNGKLCAQLKRLAATAKPAHQQKHRRKPLSANAMAALEKRVKEMLGSGEWLGVDLKIKPLPAKVRKTATEHKAAQTSPILDINPNSTAHKDHGSPYRRDAAAEGMPEFTTPHPFAHSNTNYLSSSGISAAFTYTCRGNNSAGGGVEASAGLKCRYCPQLFDSVPRRRGHLFNQHMGEIFSPRGSFETATSGQSFPPPDSENVSGWLSADEENFLSASARSMPEVATASEPEQWLEKSESSGGGDTYDLYMGMGADLRKSSIISLEFQVSLILSSADEADPLVRKNSRTYLVEEGRSKNHTTELNGSNGENKEEDEKMIRKGDIQEEEAQLTASVSTPTIATFFTTSPIPLRNHSSRPPVTTIGQPTEIVGDFQVTGEDEATIGTTLLMGPLVPFPLAQPYSTTNSSGRSDNESADSLAENDANREENQSALEIPSAVYSFESFKQRYRTLHPAAAAGYNRLRREPATGERLQLSFASLSISSGRSTTTLGDCDGNRDGEIKAVVTIGEGSAIGEKEPKVEKMSPTRPATLPQPQTIGDEESEEGLLHPLIQHMELPYHWAEYNGMLRSSAPFCPISTGHWVLGGVKNKTVVFANAFRRRMDSEEEEEEEDVGSAREEDC